MRTPLQENIIMQEARNLLALREMTPFSEHQLSAAGLPELYEGTGFQGITPRAAKLATPNSILTSGNGAGNGGATPSSVVPSTPGTHITSKTGQKASSKALALRDHFGLNEAASGNLNNDDAFSVDHEHEDSASLALTLSSRSGRGGQLIVRGGSSDRERQLKSILAQQLSSLPDPEYTYEVTLPEGADELLGQLEDSEGHKLGSIVRT